MLVDKYGQYEFEPPIETGDHAVTSLAQLITIASVGPDVSSTTLELCTQQTQIALEVGSDLVPQVDMVNELLGSKHAASTW